MAQSFARLVAPVLLCGSSFAGDQCVLVAQPARVIKLDGRDGSLIDANFVDVDGLLGLSGAYREMRDGVFTPSGEIWISNTTDARIERFSGDGQAYLGSIATGECRGLEIVGDQLWVAVAEPPPVDSALVRYDLATMAPVVTAPLWMHQDPWYLLLHQGELILSLNGYAFRHDATTGAFLGTFYSEGSGGIRQMDHLADGSIAAARYIHFRVIRLDATGAYLGHEPFTNGAPEGLAVLDDGRYVVTSDVGTYVLDPATDVTQIVDPDPAYGVFEVPLPPVGAAICAGDGSGTACPCGNPGASGRGCASSVNPSGARLAASGRASLAHDTLLLSGDGMPNGTALYFQGTAAHLGGAGAAFGDGLRCATGIVHRLGIETNLAGASEHPGPGEIPISVRGAVTAPGSRVYQCWYRNSADFCTPATFNLTNGVALDWQP